MTTHTLAALLLAGLLAAGCARDKPNPRDGKPDTDGKAKADKDRNKDKDKEKDKDKSKEKDKEKDKSKKDNGAAKPGDGERLDPPNVEKDPPNVKQTSEAGVIRGRVLWDAPLPAGAPARQFVSVNGQRIEISPTPAVRVDPTTKGVADVLVWLDRVPPSVKSPPAGEPTLTQSRGVYRPRAQFAPAGAQLRLRTTDDEADFTGSGALRFTRLLRRGEQKQVSLPRAGLLTVRSGERQGTPEAYVQVLGHSHHAVTGTGGEFELPPLPAGAYDVLLRPAGVTRGGKGLLQRVEVRLADGRGARIDWTLSGRDLGARCLTDRGANPSRRCRFRLLPYGGAADLARQTKTHTLPLPAKGGLESLRRWQPHRRPPSTAP